MSGGNNEQRNQQNTVYVGNLDERVNDTILWELMIQAGPVANLHLPKDRVTQMHQSFAFCEFANEEDADYAIRIMNLIKLFAKPIRYITRSLNPPKESTRQIQTRRIAMSALRCLSETWIMKLTRSYCLIRFPHLESLFRLQR
jgi:RNA recognition motif-containing protein